MFKRSNIILSIAAIGVLVSAISCSYDFPEAEVPTTPSLGNADISNTVFVGGTLFSGVSNGVLVENTSSQSVPQLFLNNINSSTEIEDFSATSDNTIGFNIYENNNNLSSNIGPYQLTFPAGADTTFFQQFIAGDVFSYKAVNSSLKNYSFPKSQILDFTGVAGRPENPFLSRYLGSNPQSVINQVAANQPSFFVLNLGFEDILGYAINGAEGNPDQSNTLNHTYGDILSTSAFESNLNSITNQLLANPNAKGVVVNIPDFLFYPFFTNVEFDITPYVLPLQSKLSEMRSRASDYSQMLTSFYQANPGIPFADRRPPISFPGDSQFNWGIVVADDDLSDVVIGGTPLIKVRQALRGELVFYRNEQFLPNSRGNFPENALTEAEYLKLNDIDLIRTKISEYNQVIAQVAAQSNGRIIMVDLNAYFMQLFDGFDAFLDRAARGVEVDGVPFFPVVGDFGIFSADGLNLNPRGNALIVNQIIDAVNLGFNGNLNRVNPNDYEGTPTVLEGNN